MLNQFVVPDLLPAAPEIFLLAMACIILLLDLVKAGGRLVTFVLSQLTLLGCFVTTLRTSFFWAVLVPDKDKVDGTNIVVNAISYTFSNMFVDDVMSDLLKLVLYLAVMLFLFYSRPFIAARNEMDKGEFYLLALFATLGMMVMISANHFLTIYLGLELLSLSLYAMVAMDRDSASSTEAAMKYFVLGALASGMLLYGMSMIYGATGSLEITEIATQLYSRNMNSVVLVFGLVFVVAGLAFKLGAVPFHMWVPDVYQGAPTAVAMFIGSAPKLAAFAIVVRLLINGMIVASQDWQAMLVILAVLSMGIGNIVAIAQTNIKRMLAYSAISHMGFMLLGIVTGVVGGDADFALNAYSSSMFYVVTYVLTSLGAFGMILLLSRSGAEAETLDDFKGLNQRSPWFAFIMLTILFSMAGVPFFVGFFAKFSVLQAVVASKQYWLAIVTVLFSLIGAFYYLRVVKVMYFDQPAVTDAIVAPMEFKILLSMNGLAIAFLGLFPQALMSLCAFSLLRSL